MGTGTTIEPSKVLMNQTQLKPLIGATESLINNKIYAPSSLVNAPSGDRCDVIQQSLNNRQQGARLECALR